MSQDKLKKSISDMFFGLGDWRIWSALALFDIKTRYKRSKLGQFWITISMAVTIVALAIVYSTIFKIELYIYLPLVAISFIVWGLIASLINEGATVFIESEGYLRSSPLPKSVFIYRMLFRGVIIFIHNLILVPIVMLCFLIPPTWEMLWFIPAFLLVLANGLWISIVLGTLCARFRDLPQIVASIVQIAFFISPVMWSRTQLAPDQNIYVDYNPFAIFLELLRDPLMGKAPDQQVWLIAIGITIFGFGIAIPFFARFRARIAYYL